MANWFEDLTTRVSDDQLTRRQAVRRMVGVVAGATLAPWLPEQVLARPVPIAHASNGSWSVTSFMSTGRESHTATLLKNGKVLVAKNDSNFALSEAELYHP